MISWVYSRGGRALEYMMGGSHPPPPNEQDIFAELQLQTIKELKRLYGIVTDVKDDYCLVDGRYWLALNTVAKVASHQPRKGDDVCVMLFREGQEKEWVVDHLVQVFRKGEDCWDDSGGGGDTNVVKVVENDPNAKADTRLTGSVVSVKGSNVEVELGSDKIVFSLTSAWKESFNPVELDMVQLDVKLQGDDLEDLSGCFVLSASPARSLSGDGDVSHFFMAGNTGIISRSVFVWPAVCPHGYTPRRGDTVRYHGVECVPKQANHNCTWRATRVVPKDVESSRPTTLPKEMLVGSKERQEHQQQLMMNKEGIEIEEVIDFGCVVIGESLTKDISVRNQSAVSQTLMDVTIKCPNDEGQFFVETDPLTNLVPMSSVVVRVTCTASQIGRTKVLAVFDFGEFSIGRHLMVEATHPMAVHNKPTSFSCSDVRDKVKMPIGVFNEPVDSSGFKRLIVPGRFKASKKPPTFVTNRMKQYPIPEAILDELQYEDMVGSELIDRFPTLAEELTAENHEKKFNTLLHLEEVAVEHELQKHNLSCVPLHRAGPYLTLTVPGLVEKRPSLVLGDSAVLSVPGDSRSPRFEGCVHEVRAMEVLLKFDEKFHTMYCGEVYDVAFKTSRGQVRRQHQAVELSSQQLGYEVLFPEKVVLKEPQTCFIVEKEPVKMQYLKDKKTFSKFNFSPKKKTSQNATLVNKSEIDYSCDIEDKSSRHSHIENGFSKSMTDAQFSDVSVSEVPRGEMSQSEQSSTFGTGRDVQLVQGGGENGKKKSKFDEDLTKDDIADMLDITRESGRGDLSDGIYRPANWSARAKMNMDLDAGGRARINQPQRMFGRGRARGGFDSSGEIHGSKVGIKANLQGQDRGQERVENMNGRSGSGRMRNFGGEASFELMIPGHKVGNIIGKGGEMIKRIQEETGAKIRIIQESEGQAECPLMITGSEEKVERAKAWVIEILEKNYIGKGARGGLDSSGDLQGSKVTVTVNLDSRDKGQDRVVNKVGGGGGMGNFVGGEASYEMVIPKHKVSSIIGKGGEMIKKIEEETGARMNFKRDNEGLYVSPLMITGSEEEIDHAKAMVVKILEKDNFVKTNQRTNFVQPRSVGSRGRSVCESERFDTSRDRFKTNQHHPDERPVGRGERFETSQRTNVVGPDELSGCLKCEECEELDASFFCKSCPSNLCSLCFDNVHKASKTLAKHQKSPLEREKIKRNRRTNSAHPDERGEHFKINQRTDIVQIDKRSVDGGEQFKTNQQANCVRPDERSESRGEQFETNQGTNCVHPDERSESTREQFKMNQRTNIVHQEERSFGSGARSRGRGGHFRMNQRIVGRGEQFETNQGTNSARPDEQRSVEREQLKANQQTEIVRPDERSVGRGAQFKTNERTNFVHPGGRPVGRGNRFETNRRTNFGHPEERPVDRGERFETNQRTNFVHQGEQSKDVTELRIASKGETNAPEIPDHSSSSRGVDQNIVKTRLLSGFIRKPVANSKTYNGPVSSDSDEGASNEAKTPKPQHGQEKISASSAARIVKSRPDMDDVSEKDDSSIDVGESSLSGSDNMVGQSAVPNKPKVINFRKQANEATLTNSVEDKETQLKPLKNEMKEKLKEKMKKHKENKELLPENGEANKPTNPENGTENIQEKEKSEDREVDPAESEESSGEQIEKGEDPLENLIKHLNKTPINQDVKYEPGEVSLTMAGRKFQERFNSREAWTRLLMHRPPKTWGAQRSCKLADHVTQPGWHGDLIRYLRQQGVTYSTIIQAALWPAVSRLISVVGIGGKGQGKTVGWALPLLSLLADHDHYSALPPGKGPTAVVLAAGWKAVRDIAETLADVSTKARLEVRVAAAYAGKETDIMPTLINGVDILVATPSCLLRLINKHKFTDLQRCCHFIVEEGDRLLEWFPREVESLMASWREVGLKFKGLPDQTIVVAERWSEAVKQFAAKHLKDIGLIVLGSLLEGVVYGQLPIKSHFFADSEQKLGKLLELVVGRGDNRICICCRDAAVGQELVHHLLQVGVESLFIREDDEPGDRQDKLDDWRLETRMPLIVTDLALMFVIDPIPTDILVHWDLPRDSKKEFGIRFIMLKPAMKSFFGEANPMRYEFIYEENNMEPENAVVHLMLGRDDCDMLRTIVNLLKRTGADIPPELNSFYFGLKTSQAKEAVLSGEPLCSQLASRGVCRDRKLERCNQRHFLHNEMDQPMKAASGILNFLILHVESPVRYWVRIQDPVLNRKFQCLALKMGRYNTKESNIIVLMEEDMIVGQVVVARSVDGIYRRARVLSKVYDRTRSKHRLHKIEVFMLDDGHIEFVYPGDLALLPRELGIEEFPPSAAAVVVAGLMPQDRDSDWSVSAEMFVSNKLNLHYDDQDIVCRGRILLAIGNTFWINKCQLMVRQANIGKYICAFETRDRLLESNHAVDNPGHMEPLYQLAARAGIAKPEYEEEIESVVAAEEAPDMEEPSVAFLPLDEGGCEVYVSEVYSPGEFYVAKVDHIKSLNDLEHDMGVWEKEQGHVKAGWQPRQGECVMGRIVEDEPWLRGRIKEKLTNKISGHEGYDVWSYKVSFVDTGEVGIIGLTNLRPIHQKFIKRLPFQAVKCSLAFIKPVPSQESKSESLSSAQKVVNEIVQTALNQVVGDVVAEIVETDSIMSDHVQSKTDNMNEIEVENNLVEKEELTKWSREAGDNFFDLTRNPETDYHEKLLCQVTSVMGKGTGRQYLVLLWRQLTDIGMELVNNGLAEDTCQYSEPPATGIHPEAPLKQDNLEEQDNSNETNSQQEIITPEHMPRIECSLNPEDYDISLGGLEGDWKIGPEQLALANRVMEKQIKDELDPDDTSDDDETSPQVEYSNKKSIDLDQIMKKSSTNTAPLPTFVAPAPIQVSVRSADMPAPAPALGLTAVEMKKPALVWSQDHNYLTITVTVNTVEDVRLEHVHLRVDSQGINVQVSEIQQHLAGDEFFIHTTGPLKLYSKVCTHGTTLRLMGRRLVITLKKRTTCHWRQLTKLKLGWIKLDHNRHYSTDSECEESLPVDRPKPGFLGRYMAGDDFPKLPDSKGKVHEPRYNKVTGEQVLPEHLFESSDDELGSENQDLEFLHDTAVDHNIDVPYL